MAAGCEAPFLLPHCTGRTASITVMAEQEPMPSEKVWVAGQPEATHHPSQLGLDEETPACGRVPAREASCPYKVQQACLLCTCQIVEVSHPTCRTAQ